MEKDSGITLTWSNLSYTTVDGKTGKEKHILNGITGQVKPGQMLAVMGPSGAGKSSFLDALAGKMRGATGDVLLNGKKVPIKPFQTYVHQDDALIGCLTVEETITYSARFKLPSSFTRLELEKRVDEVINEFGLNRVRHTKIGNAIIRGVSGGEKRRVTLASQLITHPPIIFLDEPTSGLDSAAAYYVLKSLKDIAQNRGLAVVATIHQPSSETYALFDSLLLLAEGNTLYFGPRDGAESYFEDIGYKLPKARNPADYYLDLINVDFLLDREEAERRVNHLRTAWSASKHRAAVEHEVQLTKAVDTHTKNLDKSQKATRTGFLHQTIVLTSRNLKCAYKNVIAYWIRVAMYVALAILMGTTWLNIGTGQRKIQDRFSMHFFSVAFLCFMSVAGIPAYLEDRLTFIRERGDGLYTVGPYVLANTMIALPFIFLISIAFSSVAYFLVGLQSGATPFFTFVGYLFLALMVAESICLFVSALIPIFVASLAIVAFLNGFFMVVQGYFVQYQNLPIWWKWANYIDYQKYAFEGIIKSDFTGLTFQCETAPQPNPFNATCNCLVQTALSAQTCEFSGEQVLVDQKYTDIDSWKWAGILIAMVFIYRIGFYLTLLFKKNRR